MYLLKDDTARIIFAHRDEDPDSEEDMRWHGSESRGVKFIYLLNAVVKPEITGNIMTRDLLHDKVC